MPVDPHRMAAAVVPQQRQVAGALLGDQNVAVRQHQQTPRVHKAGRERRRREAGRHLWACPAYGTFSTRLVTIGPVFGAGRSAGSIRKRRPSSCSFRKFCFRSSCFWSSWTLVVSARATPRCGSNDASANAPTVSAAHAIGTDRTKAARKCLIVSEAFCRIASPQSIATSVQDRHYTIMSDSRTLHRADVMHACYSVSAIAMKAQKASWHYRQSLTPAPATQAPRRAVRKAPAIRPRQGKPANADTTPPQVTPTVQENCMMMFVATISMSKRLQSRWHKQ